MLDIKILYVIRGYYSDCILLYVIHQIYTIFKIMMQAFENPAAFWASVGFTYKFCLITTTVLFVYSLLSTTLTILLIDLPQYTIWGLEIWRLFFGMFLTIPKIIASINILFSFMWMIKFFNERQKSSVYIFWELFVISLEIHILFNILSFIVLLIFGNQFLLIGYGWFPIIIVYQFRQSQADPEGVTRFCFLPCLIKKKHFPYVILVLLGLFSMQTLCIISAGIIGYYQQIVRKSNLIKLPFNFYAKFQKILPSSITNHPGFTPIGSVEFVVKSHSYGGGGTNNESQSSSFANPFRQGQNNNDSNDQNNDQHKVSGGGQGVKIDSGSKKQVDFKSYWAFKQSQKGKQAQNRQGNDQEYEIQPQLPKTNKIYKNNKADYQGEGYQQFMDTSSNDDKDEKTNEHSNNDQKQQKQKQNSNDLI